MDHMIYAQFANQFAGIACELFLKKFWRLERALKSIFFFKSREHN